MIDPVLVTRLELLRFRLGKPIVVTSGYRCEEHNKAVGGAQESQHLFGKAVDIVVSGVSPSVVAQHAEEVGFDGIGTYSTFTHVDVRGYHARWNG